MNLLRFPGHEFSWAVQPQRGGYSFLEDQRNPFHRVGVYGARSGRSHSGTPIWQYLPKATVLSAPGKPLVFWSFTINSEVIFFLVDLVVLNPPPVTGVTCTLPQAPSSQQESWSSKQQCTLLPQPPTSVGDLQLLGTLPPGGGSTESRMSEDVQQGGEGLGPTPSATLTWPEPALPGTPILGPLLKFGQLFMSFS